MIPLSHARRRVLLALLAVSLVGCGGSASLPVTAGMGPAPTLPAPDPTLIPTVNVVTARAGSPARTPVAAEGTPVAAFAQGLDHPRWLYVLPNGDVLVAETNAPPRDPRTDAGNQGLVLQALSEEGRRRRAERQPHHAAARRRWRRRRRDALGVPVRAQLALRDGARGRRPLRGEQRRRRAFPVPRRRHADRGARRQGGRSAGGPRNHHWTKSLVASPGWLEALRRRSARTATSRSTGSTKEEGRAAIWEVDAATGAHRVFASGLRNPVGMAWEPETGALWMAVNERDELGSDLVPDYMTSVRDGGFYGWPYSYYGQHVDDAREAAAARSRRHGVVPDYALGPHTLRSASPGRGEARCPRLPRRHVRGQHGSWNRKPRSGYKVIFVPFHDGEPPACRSTC